MDWKDELNEQYKAQDIDWMGHKIGAWKLAGSYDGLYYAFIDGMLDCDLKPSRYPAVTLRHIKDAYAMRFIFEDKNKRGG